MIRHNYHVILIVATYVYVGIVRCHSSMIVLVTWAWLVAVDTEVRIDIIIMKKLCATQ